jgi:hypothetical protein
MAHFLHYIYKALNCVLSLPKPNNKRGSAGRAVIGKISWWLLLYSVSERDSDTSKPVVDHGVKKKM